MVLKKFNSVSYIALFSFCWALIIGIFLQLFLLPVVFQDLHAGYGLIHGGDSVGFHHLAVEMAEKISLNGWSSFELRPEGQAPSSIAAVVYFLSGFYSPLAFLPVSAAIFALATSELYKIIGRLVGFKWAWLGVVPFVLFPSSIQIYGQLHKDIFSIAGIFLVCGSIIYLDTCARLQNIFFVFLKVTLGFLLIWFVRPYLFQIIMIGWWLSIIFILLFFLLTKNKAIYGIFLAIFLCSIPQYMLYSSMPYSDPTASSASSSAANEIQNECNTKASCLASAFDRSRQNFIHGYPEAGSNIDIDVRFKNEYDLLLYAPRAIQISLFSPFPDMWFSTAKQPGGNIMRVASSIEMLLFYAVFLVAILFVWRLTFSVSYLAINILATLIFVTFIFFVISAGIPNIGTLYRMRLAPWHIVLGIMLSFVLMQVSTIYFKNVEVYDE